MKKPNLQNQVPDKDFPSRRLLSGRNVQEQPVLANITLQTYCPAKWAIIDLETGGLWKHDGVRFSQLGASEAAEVSSAVERRISGESAGAGTAGQPTALPGA